MAKEDKNSNSEKKGKGRPAKYSEEIALRICEEVALNSCSLQKICERNEDFPQFRTVFRWLTEKGKEDFRDNYTHAKKLQAELMADELTDISDNTAEDYYLDDKGRMKTNHENINRSRLRVDTRKWIISKMLPKKYGDKLDLTTGGEKLTSQEFDLTKLSDGALAELAAARIVPNQSGTV